MSILPFVFCLLILSYHDLVLSSAFPIDSCEADQYNISCGSHDYLLKSPLTKLTTYYPGPGCGLWTVNCSDYDVPRIQNVSSELYSLETAGDLNSDSNLIIINDTRLALLISSKRGCEFVHMFQNFTRPDMAVPSTSFVDFSIYSNMTVYKCPFLLTDFHHGGHCPDNIHEIFFNYSAKEPMQPPLGCVAIVVPVVSKTEHRDKRDLFSLLASRFTIQLHVSEPCSNECHPYNKYADIKKRKKTILATAVCGAAILVISILVLILYFTRTSILFWKKNQTDSCLNVKTFLKNYDSISPKRYTHSDIKRMTNSFKVKLGKGGYGSVYKGNLQDGTPVAVKILKNTSKKGTGEEFINEVASISNTSHVNVVTLLGFCSQGWKSRSLVYEFMPNGSLEKYINNTSCQLGWETLYKIVLGIARGLEYLHRGCNTRILHLDIKPHNILLDMNFCPKIADFGLAKVCSIDKSVVSLSGPKGTCGYIAPEVFSRAFGVVSHKSDVYSYGMMVLEMVGGRKNNNEADHATNEIYFPDYIYQRLEEEEVELQGMMANVFKEEYGMKRKMTIVGLCCIQIYPNQRPSMSRVVEMLEGSLDSLQVPPKPYLLTPSLPREELESSSSQITSY